MAQLQQMIQEKKQRRQARREARSAPYPTWVGRKANTETTSTPENGSTSLMENMAEEYKPGAVVAWTLNGPA